MSQTVTIGAHKDAQPFLPSPTSQPLEPAIHTMVFAVEDSWSQEVRETTTPPDSDVQITRCLTTAVPDWSPGFVNSIDLENPDPQTFTISPNPLNAVIADCYEYKVTDDKGVINEAFKI